MRLSKKSFITLGIVFWLSATIFALLPSWPHLYYRLFPATSGTLATTIAQTVSADLEAGNLEADAMENMALMFDTFANEAESIDKAADEEEDKIYADADQEATEIESELAQLQSDEMPVEPVAPAAPVAPVEAVPQWNQPVEPVIPPAAPVAETPVVTPWDQPVTETTTTTTSTSQPAPFPVNPTEQV